MAETRTMSEGQRVARLERLCLDLFGYLSSDYPPFVYEPFLERLREVGLGEADGPADGRADEDVEARSFFDAITDGTLEELAALECADLSHVGGPVGYRMEGRNLFARYGGACLYGDTHPVPACLLMWGEHRMFR